MFFRKVFYMKIHSGTLFPISIFLWRGEPLTPSDEEYIRQLDLIAVKIRKHVIEMLYRAKSGHPGGSLSAVDAIVALYFHHMRHNPSKPKDPERDRFILSKGHAAPTLYAALAEAGHRHDRREAESGHDHGTTEVLELAPGGAARGEGRDQKRLTAGPFLRDWGGHS